MGWVQEQGHPSALPWGRAGEGGELPEGVPALSQEGVRPGNKGGRWKVRSKEPD